MADEHLKSDEDIEAILKIAIRQESSGSQQLRDRLTATAQELGISEEQLRQAEEEYRKQHEADLEKEVEQKEIEADWKIFRKKQIQEFMSHLGSYAIINGFLFFIDFVGDKQLDWAYWPMLGWGIGIAFHALSLLTNTDDDEKEFDKWRKKRRKRFTR